jgi:starch synthase (maltosyl-transferring)
MLAAFFSTGVMMPIGYEWGYRKKLDVAKSSPRDREETGVDVSSQIAEINRLRGTLPPLNVEGEQKRLSKPGEPVLSLLRGDEDDLQRSRLATLVIANTSANELDVSEAELIRDAWPFDGFLDRTPGRDASHLSPRAELSLAPGEVRIFCGSHA